MGVGFFSVFRAVSVRLAILRPDSVCRPFRALDRVVILEHRALPCVGVYRPFRATKFFYIFITGCCPVLVYNALSGLALKLQP